MKRFGFLLPFRNIVILYPKGYVLYRFRWSACKASEFYCHEIDDKVLNLATDVLVAYPIQDLYLGHAPKLKYFDRSAFLCHALSQRFKSTKWIASCWRSDTSFTGLKFSGDLNQDLIHFQGRLGAFIGEVTRFNIFENGEGCLLAPTRFGQIYEIYVKENQLHFVRLVDQDLLFDVNFRNGEIDALKRYLERHFQANSQTLAVKWWGPNSPDGIDVYQPHLFEQSLVENYVGYLNPSLPCKSTLSARWFYNKTMLKKLKIFTYAISLILFGFFVKDSVEIWALNRQYQELMTSVDICRKQYKSFEHAKESAAQIKQFDQKKAVVDTLNSFKPWTINPLSKLKKLSFYVKDHIRCHELIWLQGKIIIDSLDHTLTLYPEINQQKTPIQSLILAIIGPTADRLKSFESQLKKDFPKDQTIKIWIKPPIFETSDPQQIFEFDENTTAGFLEMVEKP
ncbi:MAG: hypothetical protein ACRYGR_06525 [Janthinobacterium lividum]